MGLRVQVSGSELGKTALNSSFKIEDTKTLDEKPQTGNLTLPHMAWQNLSEGLLCANRKL